MKNSCYFTRCLAQYKVLNVLLNFKWTSLFKPLTGGFRADSQRNKNKTSFTTCFYLEDIYLFIFITACAHIFIICHIIFVTGSGIFMTVLFRYWPLEALNLNRNVVQGKWRHENNRYFRNTLFMTHNVKCASVLWRIFMWWDIHVTPGSPTCVCSCF